jgi:hypothetical protein
MKKFAYPLLLACVLSGCTTLADAKLAKGTGMTRIYDRPYAATWKAAICSLNGKGLSIASENKSEGTILAQRGITAFSYGENIAVFVKKKSEVRTLVEVVSKKAMQTNVFAPDWSGEILDGINGCLN